MWGCSLSSCNAGNCPQTYRAHGVSVGTSLMDHICQQWSYPLICSPIWRVSSISNPNWKGSSAASAERPGRKEYSHLKGDWKLTRESTDPSVNHIVWLHFLKTLTIKACQDGRSLLSRDGAKQERCWFHITCTLLGHCKRKQTGDGQGAQPCRSRPALQIMPIVYPKCFYPILTITELMGFTNRNKCRKLEDEKNPNCQSLLKQGLPVKSSDQFRNFPQ